MTVYVGIDVSKHKVDVCWLRDPQTLKVKTRVFSNQQAGFSQLIQWLLKHTEEPAESIEVMMEATGVYYEALAYALYEAGLAVYVTNPYKVKEFGNSLGRRSKTDKRDSIVLARFLHSRTHKRWQPEPEEVRHLKALLSRIRALDTDIQREHNRQEKAQIQKASAPVQQSLRTMIDALEHERERLEQEVDEHFDNHPDLKRDRDLLRTIPGIGRVLSNNLTAVLRSREFRNAGQAAAFIGLIPIMHESGCSVLGSPEAKQNRSRLPASQVIYGGHSGDPT